MASNLETPRGVSGGPSYDPDAFGPAAERFARFFGTVQYLVIQTVLVALWIALNSLQVTRVIRFDTFPFILLNLMFSTQAAYAAPLILLAQNRQADRDKAETERDREANARSLADMEFLAREVSAIRIALEHKADREDLVAPLERLTNALEALESGPGLEESPGLHAPGRNP
jgi:uncharacterized membrane protein